MRKTISGLLAEPSSHVHFVGICGVGMAGVAALLAGRGFRVTGCDRVIGPLGEWLQRRGITIHQGHAAEHVERADWVIRTAAVADDCPDIKQARRLDLPLFYRGEVLPELLAGLRSVAVSGTHGKTTTSAFIAQLLSHAGQEPGWCIGGTVPGLDGVSGRGRGDTMIVEADESDGTLSNYRPLITVITNVEFDHREHFTDQAELEACFRTLIDNTGGPVVYCCDDPRAAALCGDTPGARSYGFGPAAHVRGLAICPLEGGLSFDLVVDGKELGAWRIPTPGRHNVLNALAAITVSLALGLDEAALRDALAMVGLPGRRLECVVDSKKTLVISDYAHHPTEIAATLEAVRQISPRPIVAVFQPHRYSRTRAMLHDFPPAFRGVERLVLTPVYAASEKPLVGGTGWDLYAAFRAAGGKGQAVSRPPELLMAGSLQQAWGCLRRVCGPDRTLLVIGAGDVNKIADWAKLAAGSSDAGILKEEWPVDELKSRLRSSAVFLDEPLAERTTLGVGGTADVFVEVDSSEDAATAVAWALKHDLPWRVLGGGSNILASDCGVRGVTLSLAGDEFHAVRVEENRVIAGAGVALPRFSAWLGERGLTGLEWLEGIPGRIGGAMRMNAGTGGRGIAERVAWVRVLDEAGQPATLEGRQLDAEYRVCRAIAGKIVLEVGFALDHANPSTVQERRAVFAAGRSRWAGRSAGSVFKNPQGDFAGRLIEAAGLRGNRVGGARVSEEHANVIVAEQGATASDVKALVEIVRQRVDARFGVLLENELIELS